jgi:hypothetical protein
MFLSQAIHVLGSLQLPRPRHRQRPETQRGCRDPYPRQFVSGARELAADPAVRVFLSAEGGPEWQSQWARHLANVTLLQDGDTFYVGNIRFQALHTPGHTPEHLSYLVTDAGGAAPMTRSLY